MVIDWTPGIGDPTAMGWFTVVAYVAAGLACLAASRSAAQGIGPMSDRSLWIGLGVICLLLGLNKQLDLQSLLTATGRAVVKSQGWYGERQSVQLAFVAAMALACATAMGWLLWTVRRRARAIKLALFGLLVTCAFVLVRAASFHHVDAFLGSSLVGLRWNWLLELGGIAMIGVAAWFSRASSLRQ